MALAGGPGHQLSIPEDGLERGHVVVLVAQAEHVVVENHIAVVQIVAVIFQQILTHRPQAEGQDGKVLALLQHLALGVVQAGDKILGLAENRRAGGAGQGDGHLLGDGLETPLQYGNQYLVYLDLAHLPILPKTSSSLLGK
jgi:hypothetical protein